MKHYVATGLAITSLLIITGCSSNAETAPAKKETVQSQQKIKKQQIQFRKTSIKKLPPGK